MTTNVLYNGNVGYGGGSSPFTGVAGGAGGSSHIGYGSLLGGGFSGGVLKSYVDQQTYVNQELSISIPHIAKSIKIGLPDGSQDTINRDELVKYISERRLRESNELVRAQWDRYQVTVKIVGSTDNGQEN